MHLTLPATTAIVEPKTSCSTVSYLDNTHVNMLFCPKNGESVMDAFIRRDNTAHRWSTYLGFKYDEHKNTYYTYGHGHIFIDCCFKNDIKAHRWVPIDDTTLKKGYT